MQTEQNLRDHSATQEEELETWRANSDKLKGSLTKKETENQNLKRQLEALEEEVRGRLAEVATLINEEKYGTDC